MTDESISTPNHGPDSASPPNSATVVARFPALLKALAYAGLAMALWMDCLAIGLFGQVPDTFATYFAAGISVLAFALLYHVSESVRATPDALVWTQLFRRRRELSWNEIDEVADRETALLFAASSRGVKIRVSRWLPGFEDVLNQARSHFSVEELLAPQWNTPLPSTFAVGWVPFGGVLFFLVMAIGFGVLGIVGQDPFLSVLGCIGVAFAFWCMPYLRLAVYPDRFELWKPFRRHVVPFFDVARIQLDTTEFHTEHQIKTGQLTNHKLVVKLTNGEAFEFAPRAGALATWLRASTALDAWRIANRHADY